MSLIIIRLFLLPRSSSSSHCPCSLLKHIVAQRDACESVVNLGVAADRGHFGALAVAPFICPLGARGLAFIHRGATSGRG